MKMSGAVNSGRLIRSAVLSVAVLCVLFLSSRCGNDPWSRNWGEGNTFYTSYATEIKTLDPAASYYSHEGEILDSIVEMPLGYDYLRRPYTLVPMLLETLPVPMYYDRNGKRLGEEADASDVSRCEYVMELRKGVNYQPHPCFALSADGKNKNIGELSGVDPSGKSLDSFPYQMTRELTSEDFKVAVMRLCDKRLASPVFSNLSSFIVGMDECSTVIAEEVSRLENLPENRGRNFGVYPVVVDYGKLPFAGVEVIDRYRFKVVMSRKYPQAKYWFAMHFFSPVPQEALDFFGEPSVADLGYQFKNWPVGTGAYMMKTCSLREHLVLEKNPNYRDVRYPTSGSEQDVSDGLLEAAGRKLPLTDRIVFNYEREAIPVWMKFQQGYYDDSGVPTDMFDSAVNVDAGGDIGVSEEFSERGVRMIKSVQATTFYVAFNMLDKVVGGLTPEKKKLRQAISIALDFHEFVNIFSNGRDVAAQSLIPPNAGISGECVLNEITDVLDPATGETRRRSLDDARKLLAEAGYPAGIGSDGKPLRLYFDDVSAGGVWKQRYQWMRTKLGELGIELESRVSDGNRHRDKLSNGDWQMMMKGWVADYPDPENFLFLFYSANGTVANHGHGMNYSNYASEEYDRIFKKLEVMSDCPERLKLIERANRILQEDAPYIWAYHRRDLFLLHGWYRCIKPHTMAKTFKQYHLIDGEMRRQCREQWNHPVRWPLFLLIGVAWAGGMWIIWRRRCV